MYTNVAQNDPLKTTSKMLEDTYPTICLGAEKIWAVTHILLVINTDHSTLSKNLMNIKKTWEIPSQH